MDKPRHLGQFYLVLRTDVCESQFDFKRRMQQMTDQVRAEPTSPNGEVLLPNDPQIREAVKRRKEGIPVDPHLFKEFSKLSEQFGLDIELLHEGGP